jgi:hypothetical protein
MESHPEQQRSQHGDLIGERDGLVGRIVDQLRSRGYYLAHIDSYTGQPLTDVRWAAQLAGRRIGRRTRTYASAVGTRLPGMVTVIVAPIETCAAAMVPGRDSARKVVEDLLGMHGVVNATRRPA